MEILGLTYYDMRNWLGQNWADPVRARLKHSRQLRDSEEKTSDTVKTVTHTKCQMSQGTWKVWRALRENSGDLRPPEGGEEAGRAGSAELRLPPGHAHRTVSGVRSQQRYQALSMQVIIFFFLKDQSLYFSRVHES